METEKDLVQINNHIYNELGERWYLAKDDPVALLRAESKVKNPWVAKVISDHFGTKDGIDQQCQVLDIGCGGGFLSNYLATKNHIVTGVDLSQESLEVAQNYDTTQSVTYLPADAYELPFAAEQFDVVTAMDFLEHVEDPERVVAEVARVLKPHGIFIFHTFNRNPIAGFAVIKMVEWLVKNTPEHMHLYRLFIRPSELRSFCENHQMTVKNMIGIKPKFFSKPMVRGILSGLVGDDFEFELTKSLMISYMGYAVKN